MSEYIDDRIFNSLKEQGEQVAPETNNYGYQFILYYSRNGKDADPIMRAVLAYPVIEMTTETISTEFLYYTTMNRPGVIMADAKTTPIPKTMKTIDELPVLPAVRRE